MPEDFFAVVIGNSSVRAGRFAYVPTAWSGKRLPEPLATHEFPSRTALGGPERDWVARLAMLHGKDRSSRCPWYLASVFDTVADTIAQEISASMPRAPIVRLSNHDFSVVIETESPDRVGTDRIAAARAVCQIKPADQPAIFIDAGTALTVNAIGCCGAFLGGAILPGTTTSGTALRESTAQLPRVIVRADQPAPDPIGRSTHQAIASGIYWGAVGAVKELIARMTCALGADRASDACSPLPSLYVTGGFGPGLAKQLEPPTRYLPDLVLSGIALEALADLQAGRG